MDILTLRANQLKSMLAQCEERGIIAPFTTADVDELVGEDIEATSKLRNIERLHKVLHELLFAPPGRPS